MASQFRKDETFVIGVDIGTYGFGYSIAQSTRGSKLCDCVITRRYHMPLTFNDNGQLINIGKTPTCFPKSYYVIPSVLPQLLTSNKTENIQMLQLEDEKGENRNAVKVVSSVLRFFKEEAMQCLSCSFRSDSDIVWNITFDDYVIKRVLFEAAIRAGLPPERTYFVNVACALSAFCDSLFQGSQGKDNCLIVNIGAGEVKVYIPRGIGVRKPCKTKKEGCRLPSYGEIIKILVIERYRQISQIHQEATDLERLSKTFIRLFNQLEELTKTVPELTNSNRADKIGQIWSGIKLKFEETIQISKEDFGVQLHTEVSDQPLSDQYKDDLDKKSRKNNQDFKEDFSLYEQQLVQIKTIMDTCIDKVWFENLISKENYASTTNITIQIENNSSQTRVVEDSTNKDFNGLATHEQLSKATNSPKQDASKHDKYLDKDKTEKHIASDRSATNETSSKNAANERLNAALPTLHGQSVSQPLSHLKQNKQPQEKKISSHKTKRSNEFSTSMLDGTQRSNISVKSVLSFDEDEYRVWLYQTDEVIKKMNVHLNSILATSKESDTIRDYCRQDVRNSLDQFRQNFEDAFSVLKQNTDKMYFKETKELVDKLIKLLDVPKAMLKEIHTNLIRGIVEIFTDMKQSKKETDSILKDTTSNIRFSDIKVSDAGWQVTQNFESFLAELIGHVTWTEFKSNHSLDHLEMINVFEKEKAVFEDSESINICLPPILSAIEVGLDEKIKYRIAKSDRGDIYYENERKLLLSSKTVHGFFKPVVDDILDMLTYTLQHYRDCSVNFGLVLVGGFSRSAYLRKRVQSELKQRVIGTKKTIDENLKIIIPLNAGEATQIGASLRRDYQDDHWFCQN